MTKVEITGIDPPISYVCENAVGRTSGGQGAGSKVCRGTGNFRGARSGRAQVKGESKRGQFIVDYQEYLFDLSFDFIRDEQGDLVFNSAHGSGRADGGFQLRQPGAAPPVGGSGGLGTAFIDGRFYSTDIKLKTKTDGEGKKTAVLNGHFTLLVFKANGIFAATNDGRGDGSEFSCRFGPERCFATNACSETSACGFDYSLEFTPKPSDFESSGRAFSGRIARAMAAQVPTQDSDATIRTGPGTPRNQLLVPGGGRLRADDPRSAVVVTNPSSSCTIYVVGVRNVRTAAKRKLGEVKANRRGIATLKGRFVKRLQKAGVRAAGSQRGYYVKVPCRSPSGERSLPANQRVSVIDPNDPFQ